MNLTGESLLRLSKEIEAKVIVVLDKAAVAIDHATAVIDLLPYLVWAGVFFLVWTALKGK